VSVAAAGHRLAIRELEGRASADPSAVDAFLAEHAFPLVEGTTVTFVWRGQADAVHLRHWVYGLPSSQAFRRLPGTDLWYHILELPAGSRVEYKLEIVHGPMHEWIHDPRNPQLARDPFGANSVCQAAGYAVPAWTEEDPGVRAGKIDEIRIRSGTLRRIVPVKLYYPARFRPQRRYPLLVVHDGSDYLSYAGLKTVLDNLVHRHEIPALVAAMLDPRERMHEYADDASHARFLAEDLVPRLEKRLPLEGTPAGRCLMGASLGAVAALAAAWRHPGVFGRLLLQSGAFAFTDIGFNHERGPSFDPVVEFVNAFRDEPRAVAEKVFVSCGTYESLIYENRSLVPLLQSTGMDVRYVEARDGHNWENWRDRLREGLSWLFPGPLRMMYE
jgi:enterochelin esterase family protein